MFGFGLCCLVSVAECTRCTDRPRGTGLCRCFPELCLFSVYAASNWPLYCIAETQTISHELVSSTDNDGKRNVCLSCLDSRARSVPIKRKADGSAAFCCGCRASLLGPPSCLVSVDPFETDMRHQILQRLQKHEDARARVTVHVNNWVQPLAEQLVSKLIRAAQGDGSLEDWARFLFPDCSFTR